MTHVLLTAEQAQQIEEAIELSKSIYRVHGIAYPSAYIDVLETIRAARGQKQAEQEPVMWVDLTKEELHQIEMTCETSAECYRVVAKALKDRNYAANIQQVEQESVAKQLQKKVDYWLNHYDRKSLADMKLLRKDVLMFAKALYATPVQQVDLTDQVNRLKDHLSDATEIIQRLMKERDALVANNKPPAFSVARKRLAKLETPVRTKDLTDDEIAAVLDYGMATPKELEDVRAVIAADREKNRV